MGKILKILFISGILLSFSQANELKFSKLQISNLQMVYKLGQKITAKDGTSFENALCGIILTESDAGLYKIGDNFDPKTKKQRHLFDSSLGAFQIRLQTIRSISKKIKVLNYLQNKSDLYITNKLLNDLPFSILVAGNYLKLNYEATKSYFTAISRYNGGNLNYTYYNKVKSNMLKIKGLVKKKVL